jgi:hypothetical protein
MNHRLGDPAYEFPSLPADVYLQREERVLYLFNHTELRYFDHLACIPRYCADKAEFTHMEVLVTAAHMSELRTRILDARDVKGDRIAIHATQPVERKGFSFTLPDIRVDVINVPGLCATTARTYYHYAGLATIINAMAARMSCRFTVRGLLYTYGTHRVKVFGTWPTDTWRALGLDDNPWLVGFPTQNEMFEWVASSPFFSPEIFLEDEVQMLERERGRDVVVEFMAWLRDRDFPRRETPPALPWLMTLYDIMHRDQTTLSLNLAKWLQKVHRG